MFDEPKIIDQVGSFIKDAVEIIREHLNISEDIGLQILLSMMSIVIGNKAHTYNGAMMPLKANLWTIILADSGVSAKSTSMELIKELVLEKLEKKIRTDYESARREYDKLKLAEKQNADEPQLQYLFSGQGSTFQGMVKNLSKNPHGLLAAYDEGSEFLNKMINDKQNKASMTSLYEQSTYGRDLVGKEGKGEVSWIQDPFISLILISNPHWFNSDVKKSDFVSGFLNRFSIVHISDKIKLVPFSNPNRHNFDKFQNVAVKIWDYLSGFEKPLEMKLNQDAITRYQEWYEKKTYDESSENAEEYNAFLVRQKTAVLKYAMIIQIFDTTYEAKGLLAHEIQLRYLNIGITIAEHSMENIEILLDSREDKSKTDKYIIEQYDYIAKKVKSYLKKRGYYEGNSLSSSKIIRQVWSINKTNFDAVMQIATGKHGIKSESREFNGDQVTTSYYYPTCLDSDEYTNLIEAQYDEEHAFDHL